MSLFGEKCARCGKQRTRKEFDGLPTCEACEEGLRLEARAASEDPRRCPIEGAAMRKEIVAYLVLDRCPTCHGVWLDGGELELMKGMIEEGVTWQLMRGLAFPGV
jgi:hypothetical protein